MKSNQKIPKKEVKVKAWAIVVGEHIVSDNPFANKYTSLAIYKTKKSAKANTLSHKIIPINITYNL